MSSMVVMIYGSFRLYGWSAFVEYALMQEDLITPTFRFRGCCKRVVFLCADVEG